jgi:feruloyl esterase
MRRILYLTAPLCAISVLILWGCGGLRGDQALSEEQIACKALMGTRNLTMISARLLAATETTPQYCYVKGIISPAIVYHVQLPLPQDWNGRFLKWGDGGKDGDLDFADHRVAQGYAVANSNTGHDNGSEPRASFGFNNRQAEIDFGNAAKTVIEAYYGADPEYSYFEGCSTGGNQGLTEAQRYPYDFDGIVAGDPGHFYQALNISHIWKLQRMFRNDFAGMLAYDTDGDGSFDSLKKLEMLAEAVMEKCDANDGITDGVIDNPLSCDFDPDVDLLGMMCAGDVNADGCLTTAQLQTIKDFYSGPYDSRGRSILKGKAFGTELQWANRYIPYEGNSFSPSQLNTSGDHLNYLFYETDPGVHMPDLTDPSLKPDKTRTPPEWSLWEFDIDDFTAGLGDFMKSITDATDPDLKRFHIQNGGKMMLYTGWADPSPPAATLIDYYNDIADTTFAGDLNSTKEHTRLFLVPGMGHCRGGPGPNTWDKLAPLVDWVENGHAPEFVVATHSTDGVVDNERRICAYPELAVYTGPSGGENDPANWVESNFTCQ